MWFCSDVKSDIFVEMFCSLVNNYKRLALAHCPRLEALRSINIQVTSQISPNNRYLLYLLRIDFIHLPPQFYARQCHWRL